MQASKSGLIVGNAIAIHTAVAALPAPTGAPSAALLMLGPAWRGGGLAARRALLKLWASVVGVNVGGPVEIVGYHAADAGWYYAATLDEGAGFQLGDGVVAPGRVWGLLDLPAWASAIQLKSGPISGGTISAAIEPLEVSGPG